METDSNEVMGGRCMSGSDGNLCFSKKKEVRSGRIIWKWS